MGSPSFRLGVSQPWSGLHHQPLHVLFLSLQKSLRCWHLVTAEEPDVDFMQWLSSTVTQVAKSAEEHEVLCAASHALTASMESQFKLSHVQVIHH